MIKINPEPILERFGTVEWHLPEGDRQERSMDAGAVPYVIYRTLGEGGETEEAVYIEATTERGSFRVELIEREDEQGIHLNRSGPAVRAVGQRGNGQLAEHRSTGRLYRADVRQRAQTGGTRGNAVHPRLPRRAQGSGRGGRQVKRYGPYRLTRAELPDAPAAYKSPDVFLSGDNLPDLRVVGNRAEQVVAFAGDTYRGADGTWEVPPATINRVPYRLRLDMAVYDGAWSLYRDPSYAAHNGNVAYQTYHSVSLSDSRGWSYLDNASPSAITHVREVVVPALAEWLASDEAVPFLDAAQASHRATEIERAQKAVNEAIHAQNAAVAAYEAAVALPDAAVPWVGIKAAPDWAIDAGNRQQRTLPSGGKEYRR
jgi:hypothetical protein